MRKWQHTLKFHLSAEISNNPQLLKPKALLALIGCSIASGKIWNNCRITQLFWELCSHQWLVLSGVFNRWFCQLNRIGKYFHKSPKINHHHHPLPPPENLFSSAKFVNCPTKRFQTQKLRKPPANLNVNIHSPSKIFSDFLFNKKFLGLPNLMTSNFSLKILIWFADQTLDDKCKAIPLSFSLGKVRKQKHLRKRESKCYRILGRRIEAP